MKMSGIQHVALVLSFLQSFATGDVKTVFCEYKESCILPCSFHAGDDVVIHWKETSPEKAVHSFYFNQDQLKKQDQHFKNRTSLFKEQISSGNASLRLSPVKVQDKGRYECHASILTHEEHTSEIDLQVYASVHRVNIQQAGNRITCSSEGIYPEPELTWSTSPPSPLTGLDEPTVQQTEQQLYSISSSLTAKENVSDLDYSCTVSAGRSKRRATLLNQISINGSNTVTTIPCMQNTTKTPHTSLTWSFNHSQNILNQTTADISEGWRKHVKYVSESGSLILQDLTPEQEGVYTCELSTAEETYVSNTFLKVTPDSSHLTKAIAGGVVGAIVVLAGIMLALYLIDKHKNGGRGYTAVRVIFQAR